MTARRHVLVIEDDPASLEMARLRLQSAGFQVSVAATGQAGLERWRAEPPDAIVLDFQLPDMDGFAVLTVVRAAAPTLPVIVVTAHVGAVTAYDALACGATAFLAKPLRRREFLHALEAALAGKAP